MKKLTAAERKTQEFNALPKAEQRIKIAKDVIAQIRAEKYIPTEGGLCKSF